MTPENAVKKHIKDLLDEWGVFYWMPGANMYGRVGVSDFIGCCHGMLIAVEAKGTKNDEPTVMQRRFLNAVQKAGGVALVIHNSNYDVLTSTLRRLAHGERA